jgi:hypothetical protein
MLTIIIIIIATKTITVITIIKCTRAYTLL